MKKTFSLLFVLVFVLSTVSCNSKSTVSQTPESAYVSPTVEATQVLSEEMPTDEFQRAIWYGFVPTELQSDLNKGISFTEFGSLVSNMLTKLNPDNADKWQTKASTALSMKDEMQRDDGIMMLFMAADSIGQTTLHGGWSVNWGETRDKFDPNTWSQFADDYASYLPQWTDRVPGGWEGMDISYKDASINFSLGETSLVSGKPLLDFDADKNSIRPSDPFTRREAILATTRLYEALEFNTFVSTVDLEPFTISPETLALANQMPAASNKSLPKWYGATMDNMSASWNNDSGMGILYWETDVQNLSKMGINFLRVPLDVQLLFQDNSLAQVNSRLIKNMDNLILWGIENGVHICFDVHDIFGFTTDAVDSNDTMFQDADQQAVFIKFWSIIAQRYATVPNNALSFDLLNEPHGDTLKVETYVALMKQAIEAIRAATPDRLIFVDMFPVAKEPIESLADAGVAQSAHIYLPGFGNNNPEGTSSVLQSTWPFYLISGFFSRNDGPVILNGDFKAGTKIAIRIAGIHKNGKFIVTGDGVELASYDLGKELVGENFCNSINEQGGDGENRWYDGAGFSFTLAEDTTQIEIKITGESQWFFLRGISITDASKSTLIYAIGDGIDKEGPLAVTIGEDGSVVSNDPEMMKTMNKDYIAALAKKYSDFSARTGVPVMIQEFGYDASSDYQQTLSALDAQLASFKENNLGWCMWSNTYNFVAVKDEWKRNGATYEQIGDNRWVATEMLDIMKKYMQ